MGRELPLVFACSGSCREGELTDRIARRLMRADVAEMCSLAALHGNISKACRAAMAKKIIVIDGCHLGCAAAALEELGYTDLQHLDLCEWDELIGDRSVCESTIKKVVRKAAAMLQQ